MLVCDKHTQVDMERIFRYVYEKQKKNGAIISIVNLRIELEDRYSEKCAYCDSAIKFLVTYNLGEEIGQ